MYSSVVLFSLMGVIRANGIVPEKRQQFLETGVFDQCEGKDSINYTFIDQYSMNSHCSDDSRQESPVQFLVACATNGQKTVNALKLLSQSSYPSGAYYQAETLFLASMGNLVAKYVYIKEIGLKEAYLKKCSSVLGYSYVSTKSQVLLIAEKLDMNIFLNPAGAYDPFKKTASTVCKGKSIIV